jgi:hypothetical protein
MPIKQPRFQSIVDLAQKMASVDGRTINTKSEDLDHVQIDSSLFGQPFPYARIYPGSTKENHINPPRKLKVEEY